MYPEHHQRTKDIEVQWYCLWEQVHKGHGNVILQYLFTANMPADGLNHSLDLIFLTFHSPGHSPVGAQLLPIQAWWDLWLIDAEEEADAIPFCQWWHFLPFFSKGLWGIPPYFGSVRRGDLSLRSCATLAVKCHPFPQFQWSWPSFESRLFWHSCGGRHSLFKGKRRWLLLKQLNRSPPRNP